MSTAIYVKTESSDSYLFSVIDDLNEEQVEEFLNNELGSEANFIDEIIVVNSDGEHII